MLLTLPSTGDGKPSVAWWKQELSSYFSSGAKGPENLVYVVTNQTMPLPRADLRCLDLNQGSEKWHQTGLGYFHFAILVTADGKLLIFDDSGSVTLAAGTPAGFQELAKAKVSRGALTNPALANGLLYVRDDKELICLDLREVE
jgi:outer membrane protein assembly factor BamB